MLHGDSQRANERVNLGKKEISRERESLRMNDKSVYMVIWYKRSKG